MKFKNLAVSVFAVSAVLSSAAFASGKNLVSCGWNGNDDSVTIREDAGGAMGVGRSYHGHGIELHVNTDGPGDQGYFKATLSIPSLGVKDEEFDCKIDQ